MANNNPLWILFIYENEAVWNLAEDDRIYTFSLDTDIRSSWNAGDVMAYYPLSC